MKVFEGKVYAVKHKNQDVVLNSRSGGFFTALSDDILSKGGIVYGCVLNENHAAVHVRATTIEERNRMRGSKYIQSKLGDTFCNIKNDLENHNLVLFSGTPCQVAGLKKYLQIEYDNLICIDILCHGVPSPLVFQKYLEWTEKRAHKRIFKIDFRDKINFDWNEHYETFYFVNGKKKHSRIYANLFSAHDIIRPSCSRCPYKSIQREGDISLGDYWNIAKVVPEFDDNKGVSLVIINSQKGADYFSFVQGAINYYETSLEDCMQNALCKGYSISENRDAFWKDFHSKDFSYIVKKYGNENRIQYLRNRLGRVKRNILKCKDG